jgi:hypothetical protein
MLRNNGKALKTAVYGNSQQELPTGQSSRPIVFDEYRIESMYLLERIENPADEREFSIIPLFFHAVSDLTFETMMFLV